MLRPQEFASPVCVFPRAWRASTAGVRFPFIGRQRSLAPRGRFQPVALTSQFAGTPQHSRPERMPQRIVVSVCVTKCSRDQFERVSSGLTVTRSRKHSRVPKSLNLRHFSERGMLLAAIRARSFVRHKHRSGTPMKSILDQSFRYTSSANTDLRKTFARIRREQRQQTQVQDEGNDPRKVFPIRQRKHA